MIEYLDILDENGKATGESLSRSEVHAKGYWHHTVHIYIFRNKPALEFLVHLRAKTKDQAPHKWDTRFGGHVKAGKTVEQTALEELKEEVGIKTQLNNLILGPVIKWDGGNNREFANVYFYQFDGNVDDLKFNDGEVEEVKWIADKDIIQTAAASPDKWTGGGKEGFEDVIKILRSYI